MQCIIEEEETSCLVRVDEVDINAHDGEADEASGHVLRPDKNVRKRTI